MTTTQTIGPRGTRWIERRGLSPETVAKFGIYTASRDQAGDVVPDSDGRIIAFPFWERGAVVNEKYRGPDKQFWQRAGGRRTFWNADVLDDPLLESGALPLIITEGEVDALSAIDCGFPLTVSVPDGAPPVPLNERPDEIRPLDPGAEQTGKFEFLWNNRDRMKRIKRFVLAVDNDPPGQRLAAELARRLSPSRCMFVVYPDGCKDLNDVLVRVGADAVTACLNAAKPYPVSGLYRLSEFPALPPLEPLSTGWWTMDWNIKLFAGELLFLLGIPTHGKSALAANIIMNLADAYGYRAAIFSPEEPVVPMLRDKFRRMRLMADPETCTSEQIEQADAWISDACVFIASDPNADDDAVYLDWLLDRATDAVLRDGIRVLLIDPWNEIEHSRRPGESITEYHGRALRMLNKFRRDYGVMVIVTVHPTKEVGREGKSRAPTPYDTDGSAHFFNKADHFLVIHRPDEATGDAAVRIAKVKFSPVTGEKGVVYLRFDKLTGRYSTLDGVMRS